MAVNNGPSSTNADPVHRNTTLTETDDVDLIRVNRLQNRLKSYKKWNSKKSYMQLALAGFSYTGFEDKVQCKDCKKNIVNWTADDDPLETHYRLSPSCPFLIDLGFRIDQQIPNYRKYANYSARLQSMQNVSKEYVQRLPSFEALARSGFFYQGTLDRMCCFQCALILRDWEPDTIPNEVHKQYTKKCKFIDMVIENQSTSNNDYRKTNADNSTCDQREGQEGKHLLSGTATVTRNTINKAPDHLVNEVTNNTLQEVTNCMKYSQQPSLNIKHRPIGRFSCQSRLREFSQRTDRNQFMEQHEVDEVDGTHDAKNGNNVNSPPLPSLLGGHEQETNQTTNVSCGVTINPAITTVEEAVLEMGYRMEDIIRVKNERIEHGEGEFENAKSLCLAVMDFVENTKKNFPES